MAHCFTGAPGAARFPSLSLANSRSNTSSGPRDDLADPVAAHGWLAEWDLLDGVAVDGPAVARLRTLRETIRALMLARISSAQPAREDLAALNSVLAAAPVTPTLEWREGRPRRVDGYSAVAPFDAALARLAADAADLLTGPEGEVLAACGAPGCIQLYLRTHAARQWCSTRCGDRVRAARHYARRRRPEA